jgi:branched-chain amino acid transport system permease protein
VIVPRRSLGFATVAVAAAYLLPLLVSSPYWIGVGVLAIIFAVAATSLNLVSGYLGEMPFGHHGFLALGAYASTLLVIHTPVPSVLGVVGAMLLTAAVGAVIGAICFRAVGAAFAIATFGFGQIIGITINGWDSLTRGVLGLASSPLGISQDLRLTTPRNYYWAYLTILLVTMLAVVWLLRSRIGRSAVAIRENPDMAAAVGINVYRTRLVMFVLSSAMIGVAGAMYAHYIQFISSGLAGLHYLVALLVMVVVGGNGTVLGPVVGAVLFTVTPELLRVAERGRLLLFAGLLLLAVMAYPKGLVPGARRLLERGAGGPD